MLAVGTMILYMTKPTITGFATTTGNTTVVVSSTSSVRFAVASVDWGTGSVNTTVGTCTLNTESVKTGCTGFTVVSQGLILENDGNANISVTLYSNVSAAQFIGNGATFQWKVTNNGTETGSCTTPTPSSYSPVNVSVANATTICSSLGYPDANDSLRVDLNITIPLAAVTSSSGLRLASITATGT